MERTALDNLHRVVKQRREMEPKASKESYQEASRRRLEKIIAKKVQTAFIGALDNFEKRFGHIWGHGKGEHECTENQLRWRAVWAECRTDVLNNGNAQLRALSAELSQYTMEWNRYAVTLTVPEPEAGNERKQEDVQSKGG